MVNYLYKELNSKNNIFIKCDYYVIYYDIQHKRSKIILFDLFEIKEVNSLLSLITTFVLTTLFFIMGILIFDNGNKNYNRIKTSIILLLEYEEIDYVYNGTKLVFYERKNDNADGYTYLTFDMMVSYYSPTRLTDNGVSAILTEYSELIKKINENK